MKKHFNYSPHLLFVFLNIILTPIFADSGFVKFINHSNDVFTLQNKTEQENAASIGLPSVLPSNTDKNYQMTLSDANVGLHFEYTNTTGLLHFSIDVKSKQSYIFHHILKQNVDYLSVNWENVLQHSDIHYVLPLFWQDASYQSDQPVRVDADNNAIIGIFSQEPNNVLTIMSYNTDKDGTGTDHNPAHHQLSDILNLFSTQQLPTPDVLMIQEGLGAQDLSAYQQTLSQLAPGKWFGYYATEGSRNDSNIILVNPKYNANNIVSGMFSFQQQTGWGLVGKRNAVYIDIPLSDIFQTPTTGNFRIFDTHLESGSGSDIFLHAAQVRLAQFQEILTYPQNNTMGMFIGGDFNTMPVFDDITGLTHYQQGSFISAFDKYLGDADVNFGQPITCTWSTCSDYTFHAGMWLDRLYTQPLSMPGYKTYVLYPFVAHQVDGYSDHLPVWVTLYFDH